MDRCVRDSLLWTMQFLYQYRIGYISIKGLKRLLSHEMDGKSCDRKTIKRNVDALIKFGFPILVKVGQHNEHFYKWDTTVSNLPKAIFFERFQK